jgi:GTPase SAR1 family protein
MTDLYDELEFPPRAEYLDQYKNYQVDIAHWKPLAAQFQKTFRQVYARRSAAVLLVYGPQGSGKSMFCARLQKDYQRTRDGAYVPDLHNNLWHVLVATDKPGEQTLRDATAATAFELVDEHKAQSWLVELKNFALKDQSRVRFILCDNAHKDSMMRPWTELTAKEFYEARQAGPDAVLAHVADRLNDACRHEFQRSIFVMLSHEKDWIESLRTHLERWFKELATVLTLPVPEPPTLVSRPPSPFQVREGEFHREAGRRGGFV